MSKRLRASCYWRLVVTAARRAEVGLAVGDSAVKEVAHQGGDLWTLVLQREVARLNGMELRVGMVVENVAYHVAGEDLVLDARHDQGRRAPLAYGLFHSLHGRHGGADVVQHGEQDGFHTLWLHQP